MNYCGNCGEPITHLFHKHVCDEQIAQAYQRRKTHERAQDAIRPALSELERLRAQLAAAEAERDALRKALEQIRDHQQWGSPLSPDFNPVWALQDELRDVKAIARAALNTQGGAS